MLLVTPLPLPLVALNPRSSQNADSIPGTPAEVFNGNIRAICNCNRQARGLEIGSQLIISLSWYAQAMTNKQLSILVLLIVLSFVCFEKFCMAGQYLLERGSWESDEVEDASIESPMDFHRSIFGDKVRAPDLPFSCDVVVR